VTALRKIPSTNHNTNATPQAKFLLPAQAAFFSLHQFAALPLYGRCRVPNEKALSGFDSLHSAVVAMTIHGFCPHRLLRVMSNLLAQFSQEHSLQLVQFHKMP